MTILQPDDTLSVMTELEKETYANGFLVCLLETWQDRAQGAIAFQCKLFDGGREIASVQQTGKQYQAGPAISQLLKLLYRVLQPPHILAVYGLGWLELLQKSKPEVIACFRILDLYPTAIALAEGLRPRAATADVAKAYGVEHHEGESLFFSSTIESILWAVVARAGEKGMTWPQLLAAAESARKHADFSHCNFDENALAALPEKPGVYAMYDAKDELLYVGKSACLRRRLHEYFQPTTQLPPKLAEIRQRIHHFDCNVVGSELEALLLEQQLIEKHRPRINVQTRVAEGRSRYAAPLLPVVVVERSARDDHVELFFFGGRGRAMQLSINPAKKPPASLDALLQFYGSNGKHPRPNRILRDWGSEGQEICRRYFMPHKDHLHWMEVSASSVERAWIERLPAIARSVLNEPAPPGEYRDIRD